MRGRKTSDLILEIVRHADREALTPVTLDYIAAHLHPRRAISVRAHTRSLIEAGLLTVPPGHRWANRCIGLPRKAPAP